MIKEKLYEDLFDKIPENCNIAIFGANITGEKIFNDLAKIKPCVNVVGFIDNIQVGKFHNLPIWRLREFVEKISKNTLVVMSTTRDDTMLINILDLYGFNIIQQTPFVSDYYRNSSTIFTDENLEKILNVLDTKEDRNLFKNLFKTRTKIINTDFYEKHYFKEIVTKYNTNRVYSKQYLDKINKNAVKTVFDVGTNDGINVIAFNCLLPNLEKTYGFEAIYDITKNPLIEEFIMDGRLEIVPYALGDSPKKINFCINKAFNWCSFGEEITDNKVQINPDEWQKRIVDVVTIDNFCLERNIKPDLIKMDIEGAELAALKGGIKTIQKYRTQLAISIYHNCGKDLFSIPIYLKENLENYHFKLGHYSASSSETVLYAIPNELD